MKKKANHKTQIMIALNTAWNLVNFRAGLITALIEAGYEVIAVAPPDSYVEQVKALGCRYVPLPMDNQGTHPGRDLLLFWRFYWLLRRVRPDVFLGYTVKPNVYGSFAAHLLDIPVVNNIAGLGAVFIRDGWLTRLVRVLYRLALSRSKRVFFQNEDDRALFIEGSLVDRTITDRLPGSGINLNHFSSNEMPLSESPVRFLLIARMLWDKGVGEYVEAAKLLKCCAVRTEFSLLGFLDVKNPAAISREQMDEWVKEGFVTYLGETDDVRPHITAATCVVLPSFYREGVPRTLLEAAATGRPIITTDAVGCREVVDDGLNGYLCKARDASDLAEKMKLFIALSSEQRAEMGRRGRAKIEREFDEKIVINKYLEAVANIVGNP
jgi:glycosyltransferase involved in cell wall biosynthesis